MYSKEDRTLKNDAALTNFEIAALKEKVEQLERENAILKIKLKLKERTEEIERYATMVG